MSKSSTATAPKRSAWSKGTPQTPSAPTVRSSAPAQTRSRRSSAFGQGVPIKDGVGIPRTPSAYSPAPPPPPHSRHPSALGQGVPNKDGVSIPRTPRSYSPAPSPPPQSHSRRPIPKKSAWSKGPPQTPSPQLSALLLLLKVVHDVQVLLAKVYPSRTASVFLVAK